MKFDYKKYIAENKFDLGKVESKNFEGGTHVTIDRYVNDTTPTFTENKSSLNESSLSSGVESELRKLLAKIKSGDGLDPRSMKSNTDGELLAMILLPVLQGIRMELKDTKGFSKAMKGRI